MLYDILIIDDVLGEEFSSDLQNYSADNEKIIDCIECHQFITELIRDNLRVTWTTGEIEDIKTLQSQDLSSIKYIFLDLHLTGVERSDTHKTINSKILGIFKKINPYLTHQEITCYINSEYRKEENYGDMGKNDLISKLNNTFSNKYSIEIVVKKNSLTKKQKNELIQNSICFYTRNCLINKAIEVEKIFDNKLKLSKSAKEKIDFNSKYLTFQSQFPINTELKNQIQLLQEIRNKLAHTDGDLSGIKPEKRTKFWKIILNEEKNEPIKIETFEHLSIYISSIDNLCDSLKRLYKCNKKA